MATCKGLGVFWKLLFRWKGSIYKLVSGHGVKRRWEKEISFSGLAKLTSLPHRLLRFISHLSPSSGWKWTGKLQKGQSRIFYKYRISISLHVENHYPVCRGIKFHRICRWTFNDLPNYLVKQSLNSFRRNLSRYLCTATALPNLFRWHLSSDFTSPSL